MNNATLTVPFHRLLLIVNFVMIGAHSATAADSPAKSTFSPIQNAPLVEIDAPRKNALGDFGVSSANHVNGMARIGDWYIVNYPNRGGEKGRIIFWQEGALDYESPFTFDTRDVEKKRRSSNPRNPRPDSGETYNPGEGSPGHMGAAGNYLAVATTGGDNIKFFDFSNPSSGLTEIKEARLSDDEGNLGFFYCPDKRRYYVLTGWRVMKLWESSAPTLEETTSWTEIDTVFIPGGEAGFPVVRIASQTFVVVSLGASAGKRDEPYGFKLTTLTLGTETSSGKTTVSESHENESFKLKKGKAGGAPSFRWGGTVRIEGENLVFYAAPKRLDASGNYYKWSTRMGPVVAAGRSEKKAYMFEGDEDRYYRYAAAVDPGYPLSIRQNWSTGGRKIVAAANWDNGYTYLFLEGGYYSRWKPGAHIQPGYPKRITESAWPGLEEYRDDIKAAINWGNGYVYFFIDTSRVRDGRYIRWSFEKKMIDQESRLVEGNWDKLGEVNDDISAAINWGNGKAYFFTEDDTYYRYDIQSGKVDSGYPQEVSDSTWSGLGGAGEITAGFRVME